MIKDKICFVTGGSRGIGSAIVKKLAKEGAHVIFSYLNDKDSSDKYTPYMKFFLKYKKKYKWLV